MIRDDGGKAIPERDFARLYEGRTGSHELRSLDHPHVTSTIVAGLAVYFLARTVLDATQGKPEDHDIPRERAEELVVVYNRTDHAPVTPLIGAQGAGVAF